MKKLSIVALAVVAVMLFAIPAMAVDLGFSGQYRARGFYMDNSDLDDDCGTTNAFYDQRFRLETVFNVHENLKVTTRLDALDNELWGTNDFFDGSSTNSGNINFDRAYLTAKFPWFVLDVGRQGGGVWGTQFIDYAFSAERIKLTSKIENFTLVGIIQKSIEEDGSAPSANGLSGLLDLAEEEDDCCNTSGEQVSDEDADTYYLAFLYKGEGWDGGLLYVYDRIRTNSDFDYLEQDFIPYMKGKFGPISVEAEFWWALGEREYRDSLSNEDYDVDAMAYYLQLGGDLGPFDLALGYAHTDGQEQIEDSDDDRTAFVRSGGRDWEPLLILTHFTSDGNLGCYGNLNMKNVGGNPFGYDMFYGTASFSVTENLTFSTIIGYAQADETEYVEDQIAYEFEEDDVSLDDDFGWEWDIGLKWKIMDNLVYDAKAGYLWAGNLFEYGCDDWNVDDTWSAMHALTVTF